MDGNAGTLADMKELGIWEPIAVKQQTFKTAIEVRLKEMVAKRVHEKDTTKVAVCAHCVVLYYYLRIMQVLYKAVSGMLPKNHFRKSRLGRLHLFPDSVCCTSMLFAWPADDVLSLFVGTHLPQEHIQSSRRTMPSLQEITGLHG